MRVCLVLMPAAVAKVKARVAFLLLHFPTVPLYRNLPTLLFCRFDVSLRNNAAVFKCFNTCSALNSYLTIFLLFSFISYSKGFALACDWNAKFLSSFFSTSTLRLHNCSPCKFKLKCRKAASSFLWHFSVSPGFIVSGTCWEQRFAVPLGCLRIRVSFDTALERANRGRFALGQCHAASATTGKCRAAEMHPNSQNAPQFWYLIWFNFTVQAPEKEIIWKTRDFAFVRVHNVTADGRS